MASIGSNEDRAPDDDGDARFETKVDPGAPTFLMLGDLGFRQSVRAVLARHNLRAVEAVELKTAADVLMMSTPWGAVVELNRGIAGGLAMVDGLRQLRPSLPLVVVGAQPTIAEAVQVMQMGAASYVAGTLGDNGADPNITRALGVALQQIVEAHRATTALDRTRRVTVFPQGRALVGESPPMKRLLRNVALVASTRSTVLILGETGTGKERIASAIHQGSPRRNAAFVAVNCAALTESLLEAEMFGHEKGAFTGAHARREGRFKMADGGTLFLDEIGELSLSLQVKLLRVLQERQFERVGGTTPISVDVRIIAATNRDLRSMVAEKTFRPDLFYRLNVMVLQIPPLRDRLGDLRPLMVHILERLSLELGMPPPVIPDEIIALFAGYPWPGNVRELENVLERLLVFSRDRPVGAADLPPEIRGDHLWTGPSDGGARIVASEDGEPRRADGAPSIPGATLREIERHAILTTYESCGRSPSRTADMLGLSLRTVHYRLREYRGEKGRRTRSLAD